MTYIAYAGWGEGAGLEISFRSSATSADSATITAPADIVAGDFLILAQYSTNTDSTTAPTAVNPADWTNEFSDGFSGASWGTRFMMSWKIAVGSEASSSITGMDDNDDSKVMLVFKGTSAIAAALSVDKSIEHTAANPALQSITSGSGSVPFIVFGFYAGAGPVPGESMSPTEDGSVSSTASTSSEMVVFYKIYNSAPANVDVDMGDSGGNNCLAGCYVQLS